MDEVSGQEAHDAYPVFHAGLGSEGNSETGLTLSAYFGKITPVGDLRGIVVSGTNFPFGVDQNQVEQMDHKKKGFVHG